MASISASQNCFWVCTDLEFWKKTELSWKCMGFKSHLLQHWFMFIALLFFDSCCIYGGHAPLRQAGFEFSLGNPRSCSWGICFLRVWHSGPSFLVFEKKSCHFKGTDSCPFQMDMYIYSTYVQAVSTVNWLHRKWISLTNTNVTMKYT